MMRSVGAKPLRGSAVLFTGGFPGWSVVLGAMLCVTLPPAAALGDPVRAHRSNDSNAGSRARIAPPIDGGGRPADVVATRPGQATPSAPNPGLSAAAGAISASAAHGFGTHFTSHGVLLGDPRGNIFARVDRPGSNERSYLGMPPINSGPAFSGLGSGDAIGMALAGPRRASRGAGRAGSMGGGVAGTLPPAPPGSFSLSIDPHLADFDGDGFVGSRDLNFLLAAWGTCPPGSCPADFTGDGQVDGIDLALLLVSWGSVSTVTPPSPGPLPAPRAPIIAANTSGSATLGVIEGEAATRTVALTDRVLSELLARESLRRLNLEIRELRADELVEATRGTAIYDDAPLTASTPAAAPVQVAANRLRRDSVLAVVDEFTRLFFQHPAALGPDDAYRERAIRIRATLEAAWRDAKVDAFAETERPAAFRRFVQNSPAHAEARGYLHSLDDLLTELAISGLTPFEQDRVATALLGPITPPGVAPELLRNAALHKG